MRLMVVGSGGREHVLAATLAKSPLADTVYCLPGNPGMVSDGIVCAAVPAPSEETLAATPSGLPEHAGLVEFAREHQVDWTIVGPEAPLSAGLVDDFTAAGLKVFGPTRAAAQIEASKDFAKQLMERMGIPTAAYRTFTDFEAARAYVESHGAPIVIKADGLAAGKGVVVAMSVDEAVQALRDMLLDNRFGDSGARVVVEDFLAGEEFSLLAFVRGRDVFPMVISQDHKRAFDGDQGPNTGGMGAYSPVPQIAQETVDVAVERILRPAAVGMVELGCPFTGILYAGLIDTEAGPQVIEFNCRFGDPEAQVVLPRLASDLVQVITDLLEGRTPTVGWHHDKCTLGVVVAAEGYPGSYASGAPLPSFAGMPDVHVYYAGVAASTDGSGVDAGSSAGDAVPATGVMSVAGAASGDSIPGGYPNYGNSPESLVAAGGRIYLVQAEGETLAKAQAKVYAALDATDTTGTFYRRDIGFRAISH